MQVVDTLASDGVIDLTPVHGHFAWSLDAQLHLVATDLHHHDRDVPVNDDALVLLSS